MSAALIAFGSGMVQQGQPLLWWAAVCRLIVPGRPSVVPEPESRLGVCWLFANYSAWFVGSVGLPLACVGVLIGNLICLAGWLLS